MSMPTSEAIMELRRRSNLTLNRLAIMSGMSRDSIYRYESRRGRPSGRVLLVLCGIASDQGYGDLLRTFALAIQTSTTKRAEVSAAQREAAPQPQAETIWLFRSDQRAE